VLKRLRLGRPAKTQTFFCVYILTSDSKERVHYAGVTRDLKQRLLEQNQGNCPMTARHRPWQIETAVAFRSQAKAGHLRNIRKADRAASLRVATFDLRIGKS
jgi:predicted GIY-YIG superfamily endonuclease